MANYTNLGVGAMPPKKSAPPPPFGAKKPALDVVVGIGGPKKPMGDAPMDDEGAETPDMEAGEESGAKLLSAIDAICDRPTAAALFGAIAKALGGDNEQAEPPMDDVAGDYPA